MALNPRIAVARCSATADYLESVRRAGGDPFVAGDQDGVGVLQILDGVRGVLLTGGGDINPRLYGEEPGPHHQPVAAGRDRFEIELVTRALERDLPILAICRGLQLLNVALGGTLVQHIPADVPRALDHQVPRTPDAIAHAVDVPRSSRLCAILDPRGESAPSLEVPVNSRHHQAPKHVAPSLVAVASAADGVIEALERPGSSFCVGVQWHPENFVRTGEFAGLFEAFLQAAGR